MTPEEARIKHNKISLDYYNRKANSPVNQKLKEICSLCRQIKTISKE